jgi:GNAT superfamily N-acetyltransferase
MQPSDLPLVMDSWLRSYEPKGLQGIDRARYYRNQRVVCERLVKQCLVVVAEMLLLKRELAGWCCYDHGVVHYVYVKRNLRGHDVGTELVEHAIGDCKEVLYTHQTQSGSGLLRELATGGVNYVASGDIAGIHLHGTADSRRSSVHDLHTRGDG